MLIKIQLAQKKKLTRSKFYFGKHAPQKKNKIKIKNLNKI